MSFQGAGNPRDGPQGRPPGDASLEPMNTAQQTYWQKRVFMASGPGPAGRSGMTNFLRPEKAGVQEQPSNLVSLDSRLFAGMTNNRSGTNAPGQPSSSDATFQSSALVWVGTGPDASGGVNSETTSWI